MNSGPFSRAFDVYWREMTVWRAPSIMAMIALAVKKWQGDETPLYTAMGVCVPQLHHLDQHMGDAAEGIEMIASGQYISFRLRELGPRYEIWVDLGSPSISFLVGHGCYHIWAFREQKGRCCGTVPWPAAECKFEVATIEELTPALIRAKFNAGAHDD